jgi:hypothetical protein
MLVLQHASIAQTDDSSPAIRGGSGCWLLVVGCGGWATDCQPIGSPDSHMDLAQQP